MGIAPLLPAVADDLGIHGVGAELVPVVIGAPPALTIALAADRLLQAKE